MRGNPIYFERRPIDLLDYDIGEGRKTGLDFIRTLHDPAFAILVTGHFDVPEIQEICESVGCGLLAQDEISQIAIVE